MAAKLSNDELTEILRAVPQRIVGRMLGGRQTVHLQRMADRWGFPVDGATVDLFAVMARLWSFLKQYGPMLSALMEDTGDGDENALGVRYLRAKIAKTEEDARAAALRNEQKEDRLIDRDKVHELFELFGTRINKANERAQKKWGADGFDFFSDLMSGLRDDIHGMVDDARRAQQNDDDETSLPESTKRPARKREQRSRKSST